MGSNVYARMENTTGAELKRRIEESYNHIKPYLGEEKELHLMCRDCERWNGKEHDYTECRDRPCFIYWLAFEYMHWSLGYELYGG